MNMRNLRSQLKSWMPPVISELVAKFSKNLIKFEGAYHDWDMASCHCTGYSKENILSNALSAALKVQRGEAAFERDSVLFDDIEYSWPVTAGLMLAAAQNSGRLHVVDFGGAFASSYYQNIKFLNLLEQVKWSVVEQSNFVDAGSKYISNDSIKFYKNTIDCLENGSANVLLLSSVLQYIEAPYKMLDSLMAVNAQVIIFDRTPFLNNPEEEDVIKIQHVPDSIYTASYPCWFFSKNSITHHIEKSGYRLVENFASVAGPSKLATWRGMIFIKEDANVVCE